MIEELEMPSQRQQLPTHPTMMQPTHPTANNQAQTSINHWVYGF